MITRTLLLLLVIMTVSCSKENSISPNEEASTLLPPMQKGIISTGTKGIPIPQEVIDNQFVDGYMILDDWSNVEIKENTYDWSFIDSEVNRASSGNKKVRIAIHTGGEGIPSWVMQNYPSIKEIFVYDKQTLQKRYHPAYWDETFIRIKSNFYKALADRYKNNETVFAISISMVDPNTGDWDFRINDDLQKQSFLDAGFTEEVFVNAYKTLIDNAMENIKNKYLITAVGPISSALVSNEYSALYEVLNYSFNTYGDQLIIAKGSLNANTPNPNLTSDLITWQIMWDFKPHCAGQFVWSVTNDPDFKMNGRKPYSNKDSIFAAAFDIGIIYGLNWIEPWKADILNPDLQDELENARNILIQ
ncbi:beta-galactosidase [Thermophagus sp. OGC60D27]|uniref:beta-galactosidase n=1 Tax=Thermophagus sp. OGC60D27 TaxID=3458415 RepID=UPI004037CCC6